MKIPSPLLVRTNVWPVARSLSVRVAPGITAPCGSVTVPWIEVRYCARAGNEEDEGEPEEERETDYLVETKMTGAHPGREAEGE